MEDKVQINIRIPRKLHDRILKKLNVEHNTTKTEIITAILEKYFLEIDEKANKIAHDFEEYYSVKTKSTIDEIESMFSLGEKVFMSKKVYKQLLQKSQSKIEEEIKKGLIDSIKIADIEFVVIESSLDTNSIIIEQILQKKEIVLLKKRLETAENKILNLEEITTTGL